MGKLRKILKWGAFAIAVLTMLFTVTEHYGVWDGVRCTDEMRAVAEGMNTSYQSAQRIFRPTDPQWNCFIKLIHQNSSVEFPEGKEPKVIGRFVAIASEKKEIGPNQVVEWTAPSTPVLVLFKDWSENEVEVGPKDYIIVGTIGDLSSWIEQDKNNFSFKVQNIFLGLLSLAVTLLLLLSDI